jgi:Tol biopolymer transport system component
MFNSRLMLIVCLGLLASVLFAPLAVRGAAEPQLLTNGLVAGETLIVDSQQLSPDSQSLLFLTTRDVDIQGSTLTLTLRRLYRTSLITGQTTALTSDALPTLTSGSFGVSEYTISPDSQTVVFTGVFGDRLGTGQFARLSTIPIGGGAPTVLDQIEDGGIGTFTIPKIDPTGARVLYLTSQILRSVPITGGTPTDLIDSRGASYLLDIAKITPDGTSVVVFAQRQSDTLLTLFRLPVDGG